MGIGNVIGLHGVNRAGRLSGGVYDSASFTLQLTDFAKTDSRVSWGISTATSVPQATFVDSNGNNPFPESWFDADGVSAEDKALRFFSVTNNGGFRARFGRVPGSPSEIMGPDLHERVRRKLRGRLIAGSQMLEFTSFGGSTDSSDPYVWTMPDLGDAPSEFAQRANVGTPNLLSLAYGASLPALTGSIPYSVFTDVADSGGDHGFNNIFTRCYNNFPINSLGLWGYASSGSTPTGNTGPGTNTAVDYMYTESSFSPFDAFTREREGGRVLNAGLIGTGTNRSLTLDLCLQGQGFSHASAGLEIRQLRSMPSYPLVSANDDVISSTLVRGWPYSNSYIQGSVITNYGGLPFTCKRAGGWYDVQTYLADDCEFVLLLPQYPPDEASNRIYRTDFALHSVTIAGSY